MRPRLRTLMTVRPVFLVAAGVIAAWPSFAGTLPVELTPILGVRGGATMQANLPTVSRATADPSLSVGFDVVWFVRPDGWFETFIDHQKLSFTSDQAQFGTGRFDLSVDYVQFGGGYEPLGGRVRPFVTAALGLTHFGATAGTVKTAIAASGSLGGGFKVPIGKHVSFRFEVRGYATLADGAVSVACGSGCLVQFSANGWFQLALRAGIAVRLPATRRAQTSG